MNFTEILAEMVARGAENNSTRNGRWANLAYREIGNAYDWPFTEATATGAAGAGFVAVTNLRKVIVVGDVSQASAGATPGRRLQKAAFEELSEDLDVENVAQAGTPDFWWYDATAGRINGYPLGGTIYVRYRQRLDELSGVQTPVFDEEYHLAIVDRGMVEVYNDTDEFEKSTAMLQQYERRVARMAQDYQVIAREHSYIQVGIPYDG